MVPKFKITEIRSQETLGEKLKKIRISLKLTYDEIEKRTKIRKKYIKALETNDYDLLPNDVYAKGFIKNYANILGVEEDIALKLYKKERGIADNLKHSKNTKKEKKIKKSKLVITPKTLIVSFVTIVSLFLVSYIGYEIFLLTSAPRLEITFPSPDQVIENTFIEISGKTDPGTEVYINGQKVNTSEEGDFKVSVSIGKNGVNSIKILARNPKNGKTKELARNIIANIPELASKTIIEEKKDNLLLLVEVGPNTAWLKIRKDKEIVFEGIVLPGTIKDFEAQEEFLVTTGNAGSTKLIFNGNDLGTLGKEGELITDFKLNKETTFNKEE